MLEKRYYWLKLKKDFFKRHDIVLVEAMPNGKDYILFYLKLLLESIEHEGELRFNDTIPYNEQMLAVITNTNVDMVKAAMKVFIGLKMVEMLDDGTIFMTETEKMIGSECSSANRVRDYREKKQALQCNNDVTKCNIDIKKETDTETNITAPPKCPPKVSAICQADTGSAARRHCNLSAEQYAPGKTKAINPNSGKDECNNRKRHLRINGSPEMPFLHIV